MRNAPMRKVVSIPVDMSAQELLGRPEFVRLTEKARDLERLLRVSRDLLKPRGVFTLLKVTGVVDGTVQLEGGHALKSVGLADMVRPGGRLAPYAITIGPDLEQEASRMSQVDVFAGWALGRIGDYALGKASLHMRSMVEKELGEAVSSLAPGAGTGRLFGIDQQTVLFDILDPTNSIGVKLTQGYLMVPLKSISGVFAATNMEYVACRYCPKDCEYRRAEFGGEYLAVTPGGIECDGRTPPDRPPI
jgi:hypothetical protein